MCLTASNVPLHDNNHVQLVSKWHPTMNLATKCAEKVTMNNNNSDFHAKNRVDIYPKKIRLSTILYFKDDKMAYNLYGTCTKDFQGILGIFLK